MEYLKEGLRDEQTIEIGISWRAISHYFPGRLSGGYLCRWFGLVGLGMTAYDLTPYIRQRLVDLWIEYNDKLEKDKRILLPLKLIYFIAPDD